MTAYDGLVGYFGYGSLVNPNTLRTDYVDIVPATLKGWRRHWQSSVAEPEREIAMLSIHRAPHIDIHGMIVLDREENLPLVDEREIGYERDSNCPAEDVVLGRDVVLPDRLYVYVGLEDGANRETGHLLQSYLDAVLQGFALEYGDDGVHHFVETTTGFDRHLVSDRHAPQYPRSVRLSETHQLLIDEKLGDVIAPSQGQPGLRKY